MSEIGLFHTDGSCNPSYLKLDLFCKGLRVDESCNLGDDARDIIRNRAGLGSGLEVIIGADMYSNIPVVEWWVQNSPYWLVKTGSEYEIWCENREFVYEAYDELKPVGKGPWVESLDRENAKRVASVRIPEEPKWYKKRTSSGKLMQRIGCLQGTYLGIYWGPRCNNWGANGENEFCKFCTEGQNLGTNEEAVKSIEDVVETVIAARQESGITFVHINTGFIDSNEYWDLFKDVMKAVKDRTGLLIGLQAPPDADFDNYYKFKKLGVNNVSL